MASRLNKFAPLSPEYEAEEKERIEQEAQKKKKEVKKEEKKEVEQVPKEEVAPEQPVEANKEPIIRDQPQRGQGYRGNRNRYRGSRGSYRSRDVIYVPKGTGEQRDSKDFRFHGSNDDVHPYDRRSGTGRGTEIPKEGSGRGNWGQPGDELKYDEPLIEEKPSPPIPEAKKEGEEKKEEEKVSKTKRKRRKEHKKEEKEEEILDKDGTALTYKEYQAKLAKEVVKVEKKPEEKVVLDPKKAEKVTAHVKQTFAPIPSKHQEIPTGIEKEVQPSSAIEGLKLLGKFGNLLC